MINQNNAISVNKLDKFYSEGLFRRKKFHALKGIDLTIPQGEIFGLLGPNGAGKTTFVKIMLGIVEKSSGDAEMMGCRAGSPSARKRVGYLPENLRMRQHHTANTALEFYGGLNGLSPQQVRAKRKDLLGKVGLSEWANAGIKKFSKGMLQRLGLAQALLHDPEMIFLDEPTDGLDPQARAELRDIMSKLRDDGKTIFINSHILQEVELICDSVAILDHGELKYCGPVRQIGDFIQNKTGVRIGSGITFVVRCSMEKFHAIAEPGPDDSINSGTDDCVEFYCTNTDTGFVNSTIDRFRASGVDILEVSKRNVTLEEAFLTILSSAPSGAQNDKGETE